MKWIKGKQFNKWMLEVTLQVYKLITHFIWKDWSIEFYQIKIYNYHVSLSRGYREELLWVLIIPPLQTYFWVKFLSPFGLRDWLFLRLEFSAYNRAHSFCCRGQANVCACMTENIRKWRNPASANGEYWAKQFPCQVSVRFSRTKSGH